MEKFEHVYCPRSGVHKFKFLKIINNISFHQCIKCGIILGSDMFYRTQEEFDEIPDKTVIDFNQRRNKT